MNTTSCLIIAFLALNTWAVPMTALAEENVETISIVQLLATPEKYEEKLIAVRGFVRLEFEGNAIYLHKEDYEQALYSNGLWLNAGECKHIDGKHFDTGYAWVTGRFTAKRHGHRGAWAGELREAKCVGWPLNRHGS